MNQLSKTTIIGFFFLFLGTIELIGAGIMHGLKSHSTMAEILIIFALLHLIFGYGYLISPAFFEPHRLDNDKTPEASSTPDEKDPDEKNPS